MAKVAVARKLALRLRWKLRKSDLPSAAGRVFSFLSDNSDVVREEIVRQPDACRVVKVAKQA